MARIGFKKTYAQGEFDKAAVGILFGHIKNTLIGAGFQVILNTSDAIDVMPMGADPAIANDDTPHWAFVHADLGTTASISAIPVFGANYLDKDARASNARIIIDPQWRWNDPNAEITFWFAADGAAGWWWLHAISPDATRQNGQTASFARAGVTTRRYPADQYQGISARYGLWEPWGYFMPAYAVSDDGTLNSSPWTLTWSPFGMVNSFVARRHPGSPLPRMAVPAFPDKQNNDVAACIYGEFNEILILTDGYAQEEQVVPGWIAMTGNEEEQPYAVPAPDSFTVL